MRIFLGSVAWRNAEIQHMQSMLQLWNHLSEQKIDFQDGTVVGDALISRSRSIVASAFLRSNCDVLLTIDSDIWFRPQDAVKLAEEAFRYHMIGSMYVTRSATRPQPAVLLPDEPVYFDDSAKPLTVRFISTGFMAVHRSVFERVSKTLPMCHKGWNDQGSDTSFWPFYMPFVLPDDHEENLYLSEDWAFCERARQAGYKIWLDPSIRLGHVGNYMFTNEDLAREARHDPAPMRLTREPGGALTSDILEPVRV